jgi:beta-phosphoglucomutase
MFGALMIKWIFFDLDGVLVDSRQWHFRAFQLALNDHGYSLDEEEHRKKYDGLPTKVKLKLLAENLSISQEKIAAIEALKHKYTRELLQKSISKNSDLIEVLKEVKSVGLKAAVCSNAISETVRFCLQKMDIKNFFEFELSNEDVKLPKPSPEIYLKAMKIANVQAHEVLIIEDSLHGLKAARESGCHVLAIKNSKDLSWEKINNYLIDVSNAG